MKLLLIPVLLLGAVAGPSAPVRFEADGVRVGSELVTGASIALKDAGALPLLVSGSVVESLSGESLAVALGEKQVLLGAGLRLARTADGFRISTHGMPFTVAAGGTTLPADRAVSFTITEKGFDFGALGTLEGTSFAASVTSAVAPIASVQSGQEVQISPEKTDRQGREKRYRNRYVNPLAGNNAASKAAENQIPEVTPNGAP
jgi:hypothetical protein